MTRGDIECIIKWFSHIEQLATDGKTANGFQMPTDRLLTTIKVVAKDSREYVEKFSNESIPNDLEEVAKEYAKTTFKKPYSDNPDEEVTIVEPDKYAGFIAGAKWDREQMMSEAVEGFVAVDFDIDGKRRVTFFPQKPVRDVLTEYKYWAATRPRYESIKLDSNAFPNLKWEDEPKKVKFIIVKED